MFSFLLFAILLLSTLFSLIFGTSMETGSSMFEGAGKAVEFSLSIGGGICLWSAVMELMERCGVASAISKALRPLLIRLFPCAARDRETLDALSQNVSANLLGLGNAATPMGISAARRLKRGDEATDELCRLIVLNTASIQLIPGNVAAVRASLGSESPFDILPAVWVTSLLSAGLGITAAWLLGKGWKR